MALASVALAYCGVRRFGIQVGNVGFGLLLLRQAVMWTFRTSSSHM
jgi:hypothetical protein